jgi:hypothetical protein
MVATEPSSFGGDMKRYLFINDQNTVVHLIEGDHNAETLDVFLNDFGIIFGAIGYEEVDLPSDVWLDWTFDGESFNKPVLETPVE